MANAPTIEKFGIQSGTDRTLYIQWAWKKKNTKEYRVFWEYATGDGIWFSGSDTKVKSRVSTYTAPDNVKKVRVKIKPISDTHKVVVNNKTTTQNYWTAKWSTYKTHDFSTSRPAKLSAPTMTQSEFNKDQWLIEIANIDTNWTGDGVDLEIWQNDAKIYKTVTLLLQQKQNRIAHKTTLDHGNRYKARVRGFVTKKAKTKDYGYWSDFSSNILTRPSVPDEIIQTKSLTSTSVYIEWTAVKNCTSYEIQYTTKIEDFVNKNESELKSYTIESVNHAEITGMETGCEYFFRVRAINSAGNSEWCERGNGIVFLGRPPSAPTTWSSSTTVSIGEDLILYWIHNSEDGSSQTSAELELDVAGNKRTIEILNSKDEFEKDKISHYSVWDDNRIPIDGGKVKWRVRTKGIMDDYSEWSILRTVDVYTTPTLMLTLEDIEGISIDTLTSFPMRINGVAGPKTQSPLSYSISVVSLTTYETVNQIGEDIIVSSGDVIYSQYFDINSELSVELSAGDIDLENNQRYRIRGTAAMDSGLKAESYVDFDVAWEEVEYNPNADIGYNSEDYSVQLRPYCEDENGVLVEDVLLSVYRRNFDGEFIEITSGIDNTSQVYVIDPHPTLDYARYRIVATSKTTGTVSYYDMPGLPIFESSVILQWNDSWSDFNLSVVNETDEISSIVSAKSLLKLPYNIDVSEKTSPDVSLVKYIGRKRPVSYYGTQLGETASWKVEIPSDDKETIYALRRLAIWQGDVYVREPSGSGYWANVNVSFSQTHMEVKIPVTLELTRVEGGV